MKRDFKRPRWIRGLPFSGTATFFWSGETESGLWSLPGGWVDVNRSVRENTAKEVWEEAGLEVEPVRLIALHDRNRHNPPLCLRSSAKSSFSVKNGVEASRSNVETSESRWFGREELPPMALEKNTPEQVRLCF